MMHSLIPSLSILFIGLSMFAASSAPAAETGPPTLVAKVTTYLPENRSFHTASCDEVATAIGLAVAENPTQAPNMFLETVRYLRLIHSDNKQVIDKDEDPYYPSQDCMQEMLVAAMVGAPGEIANVIESLLAAFPEYGPAVEGVLNPRDGFTFGGNPGGFRPGLGSAAPGGGGGVAAPGGGGSVNGPPPDDEDERPVTPDQP